MSPKKQIYTYPNDNTLKFIKCVIRNIEYLLNIQLICSDITLFLVKYAPKHEYIVEHYTNSHHYTISIKCECVCHNYVFFHEIIMISKKKLKWGQEVAVRGYKMT